MRRSTIQNDEFDARPRRSALSTRRSCSRAETTTDEKAGDADETGDDVILADEDLEPPEAGPRTDGLWEPLRGEGDESGNERPTKRHRQELLEIYYAKLETLFKARQRKEIKLKELSKLDTQAFFNATAKEIRNNLETGAYKMLDDHTSETVRAMKPERIMESRYVRTAKPLEADEVDKAKMDGLWLEGDHGGPCKAKVRHVMKGFSEEVLKTWRRRHPRLQGKPSCSLPR